MRRKLSFLGGIGIGVALSAVFVLMVAASSTEEISPVKSRERDVYLPNSEDLGPEEMRVIACGTGMPNPRMAQAAACFLVELGNGDKFIFDIGSGSVERLAALDIPWDWLSKVFIGHLHGDHFGDLGGLFVGGGVGGRHVPLKVWGPSGATPELGTAYAVDHMEKMYTWDIAGRLGQTDIRGFTTEVHEFDYKTPQVIYEENGVKIRAWPAIHAIDGAVSFSLEWAGLKFVFSSDTFPNKWFNEYAQDADLAIHECFIAVPDLITKWRLTPEAALQVGTQIHTAPEAFGKVMSTIRPRHMVWNVTKDKITERVALVNEHTWNPPLVSPAVPPDPNDRVGYSPEIWAGRFDDVDEVIRPIYEEAGEALGREFKYPGDD
jgi:ribonuclease Z